MRQLTRRSRAALIAVLAVIGTLVVAVVVLNSIDFASFLSKRATAMLARPVTIANANLKLSFKPQFDLEGVTIANLPGGSAPNMLEAESLNFGIDFWKFLRGQVTLPHVEMSGANILFEYTGKGPPNWIFSREADESAVPSLPQVGRFTIRDTKIRYRDVPLKADMTMDVLTQEAGEPGKEPNLVIKGGGTYLDAPAKVDILGGSVLALSSADAPYPVDATIVAGPTRIEFKGHVTDPMNVQGLNIRLTVSGQDAAELYPLFGVSMFPTPPYKFSSQLDRAGGRWVLTDFTGTFGNTDVAGRMDWDISGDKPLLKGDLTAKSIDLDDLAGFIGASPGENPTPDAEKRAAAQAELRRRIEMGESGKQVATQIAIPDRPMSIDKLNNMNAEVTLKAGQVVGIGFPMDSFAVNLHLKDGVLTLDPATFGVDKGKVALNVKVDGRKDPAHTEMVIDVERFPLRRLVGEIDKDLEKSGTTAGVFGGRIKVAGTGNSLHKILASGNGDVGLVGAGGRMSLLLVELLDLDIAEALVRLIGKDKPVAIRCLAVDAPIQNGLLTARTLVVDTDDTVILGSGTIDFGTEVLDMKLDPKPKDSSPLALRAPILITGSFSDPAYVPDPAQLAMRGGAAIALGALLTPLAALLPLIETGGADDVDCDAVMRAGAR